MDSLTMGDLYEQYEKKYEKRIILLCGNGPSSRILYNFLQEKFSLSKTIIEQSPSKKKLLARRIKNLGLLTVTGQLIFQLTIYEILKLTSKMRIKNILKEKKLSDKEIPRNSCRNVSSVNSEECLKLIKSISPDIVLVSGTRIISKKILDATSAVFINIHAGITPRYRGTHGAYWSLVENKPEHCGVTVHFIDEGIDTGEIISQDTIAISNRDNFATHPYIQLAKGISLLNLALVSIVDNNFKLSQQPNLESRLWYHPTIWSYLLNRLFKTKTK